MCRIEEIQEHLEKSEMSNLELGVSLRDQSGAVHVWYGQDVQYLLSENTRLQAEYDSLLKDYSSLQAAKISLYKANAALDLETSRVGEKLSQYQKIGESSELRKVTFCKDCARGHRRYEDMIYCTRGDTTIATDTKMWRSETDYCSKGEPREDRENEP